MLRPGRPAFQPVREPDAGTPRGQAPDRRSFGPRARHRDGAVRSGSRPMVQWAAEHPAPRQRDRRGRLTRRAGLTVTESRLGASRRDLASARVTDKRAVVELCSCLGSRWTSSRATRRADRVRPRPPPRPEQQRLDQIGGARRTVMRRRPGRHPLAPASPAIGPKAPGGPRALASGAQEPPGQSNTDARPVARAGVLGHVAAMGNRQHRQPQASAGPSSRARRQQITSAHEGTVFE